MAHVARRPRTTLDATEQHRAWLELVDTEGPFLAIPPLKRVWPQGMPSLADTRKAALVEARRDFEAAWEKLDRASDSETIRDSYRTARDKWVETVLRDVAGWAESLTWGEVAGVSAHSPNHAVTIRAQACLDGVDGIGALVHVIDPVDSLRQTPGDLWAANPIDRVETMLRGNKVPIGIVTDGRWWGLVCAREGAMAASGIVDALTWIEEPRTRDAFLTLIGRQYLVGGDPTERLPTLFEESVAAAEEITEALGAQVRRAVELLIQSFSESAADARRRGVPDPLAERPHDTYEAAVTVMMRVVFLLFAEERGLLPSGELFEQGYGIARELDRLIARETEESEEALDSTSLTWHRLLATSQALYGGASFENLRMPSYGGSLFDPARFPFLTATNEQGTLAISVSDRVMLHVLRSVQIADIKGEARRISFRDIDVEQIGYIYEGLLGYSAAVADEVIVGLKGTLGEEPEIPLAGLEALAAEHSDPKKLADAIRSFVEEDQPSAKPQSVAAIAKAIGTQVEPSVVSALTQAVGDDLELRDRVMPWLGLIRLDLRRRPFVVLDGGLIVKETPSRKNAGAHYTPKSLAEEVVLHALQPLCYSPGPHQTANEEVWKLKSSDELLDLKVADIACGSGAFLVAAARYLAERVVEAWTAEDPSNAARKDLYTHAVRQVVANCLYGADINDMAVEMCKLSLWLVSLDRDLPFSFVDDKVFLGNSLLGLTSLKQLRNLHIDGAKKPRFVFAEDFDVDVDGVIRKAADLRRTLATPIDDGDPARSGRTKMRQLKESREATAELRRLADGVIATALPLGGKPGKALEEAYDNLRIAAKQAEGGATAFLDRLIQHGLTPTVPTDYERWQPLHWMLEIPDVFVDHGGFDALIGNPPFLGGKKVSGAVGSELREWLVNVLADGAKGNADLVAYFFLRAMSLLNAHGSVGLIATNSVAQGDTREVGLDRMVLKGFTITRAVRSARWPAMSASLEYAAVWGTRGPVDADARRWSDGRPVWRVSTYLEPEGRVGGSPGPLLENKALAFVGSNINCVTEFSVPPELAREWIHDDPLLQRVVRPFLSGKDDINGSPSLQPVRWIVDFTGLDERTISTFGPAYEWVLTRVRPARALLANKPKLQREWWLYERPGQALRDALAEAEQVLVLVSTSRTVMPVRVAADHVFSHGTVVFTAATHGDQAVLSSSHHQSWAIKFGSGMKDDPRYTPTDVFETFPRPLPNDRLVLAGRILDEERREIMIRRHLGLTALYNQVNDPRVRGDVDIDRLREIHLEVDQATLEAYGWSDVPLDHGFHTYRQIERWTVSPTARVEILDRLLEENQRRAAAEGRPGKVTSGRKAASDDGQDTLFGQ